MRFRIRLSVRNRILLTVIPIFLVLAIAFAGILIYEIQLQKQALIDTTKGLARTIGDQALVHLQSGDKTELENKLQRVKDLLSLEALYIFDANNTLFFAYPTTSYLNTPYDWRSPHTEFVGNSLHLIEPLTANDQPLGSIYLRVSIVSLHKKIRMYFWILPSAFILASLVSISLVYRLQKFISVPILRLTHDMKAIPESVSFTVDRKEQATDEIGALYSGFDKLLRKLERREEQRDRAETALRESERRYRNLVESNPDTIFLQQDRRIIYMNPSGLKLLGHNSETEILGKDMNSYFQSDSKDGLQSGGTFDAKLMRSDGKVVDVDVTLIETTYNGLPAIQGVLRDITERKQLRESADRIKRLAAIGELSAQIAHEIRNSLATLQLNLGCLSDQTESSISREKAMGNMQLAMERMGQTVRGILSFAKPNPPMMKMMAIHPVLESSLKAVERELEESNIRVIRNYDESLPELSMDPNQVHQALLNLFLNARQAMRSGGILTVTAKSANGFLEIEVADTGEGIAPENIEKVFDPFFTTKSEGTGLGLAIVERTLQQHGAQISVESNPGAGSSFHIRFPLKSA